jgi:ribose 5-phosphate isomerase B
MKLFIGADHAGFSLKNQLREHLTHAGFDVEDVGAMTLEDDDDYPGYAFALATKLIAEEDGRGVLVCGSGQGMSIAANRVRGIRAGLAWDKESARVAKTDDNCNVLVLPSRFVDEAVAADMVDAWLAAEFNKDPKYQRRLDEVEDIYG